MSLREARTIKRYVRAMAPNASPVKFRRALRTALEFYVRTT